MKLISAYLILLLISCSHHTLPARSISNDSSLSVSTDELKDLVNDLADDVMAKRNKVVLNNRHAVNDYFNKQCLNNKKWARSCCYEDESTIIIAFEGTGAFDPHVPFLMNSLHKHMLANSLKLENKTDDFYQMFKGRIESNLGKEIKWSGIQAGAVTELVANTPPSVDFRIYSFPSEEIELIDQIAEKNRSISEVVQSFDIRRLSPVETGINSAIKCFSDIQSQIKEAKPHFILLAHSSGSRSAIKFAEKLRSISSNTKIDLLFTVDPVIEAHKILKDLSREIINKKAENLANGVREIFRRPKRDVYPPVVASREHPQLLYKPSNVSRHINFYQKRDTKGFGLTPAFGIHGSSVVNADENSEIYNLGEYGHGEITYQTKVKGKFVSEFLKMINNIKKSASTDYGISTP
jgi:hypothetical protein